MQPEAKTIEVANRRITRDLMVRDGITERFPLGCSYCRGSVPGMNRILVSQSQVHSNRDRICIMVLPEARDPVEGP
jgi:hypothetical protein